MKLSELIEKLQQFEIHDTDVFAEMFLGDTPFVAEIKCIYIMDEQVVVSTHEPSS